MTDDDRVQKHKERNLADMFESMRGLRPIAVS